nr:MAG TPA: hypothetical protein [Caudoviricetes sp.]
MPLCLRSFFVKRGGHIGRRFFHHRRSKAQQ